MNLVATMNHWSSPHTQSDSRRRLVQTYLKRCPLCEAINATSNESCFVCGWHGKFDQDPHRLEESLLKLISECPSYAEPVAKPRLGWWVSLRRVFRRRVDYQV